MNQLLCGGRPISALTKDCCYRDISSLAEDVHQLQREKSKIQAKYDQAIKSQNNALQEIAHVREQNEKLTEELNNIKDVALSVESEANVSLENLYRRNTALKLKLNDAKKRVQELESKIGLNGEGSVCDLKTANMKIKFLQEQLKNVSEKGKCGNDILIKFVRIFQLFYFPIS